MESVISDAAIEEFASNNWNCYLSDSENFRDLYKYLLDLNNDLIKAKEEGVLRVNLSCGGSFVVPEVKEESSKWEFKGEG